MDIIVKDSGDIIVKDSGKNGLNVNRLNVEEAIRLLTSRPLHDGPNAVSTLNSLLETRHHFSSLLVAEFESVARLDVQTVTEIERDGDGNMSQLCKRDEMVTVELTEKARRETVAMVRGRARSVISAIDSFVGTAVVSLGIQG